MALKNDGRCATKGKAASANRGLLWMCGRNDFGQVCYGTRQNTGTFVKVMDKVTAAATGGFCMPYMSFA